MKSNKEERPIRILHVLGGLNFGGAETMVMNLYRAMDRTQIQFDFAIHISEKCDYEDEVLSLGGKIYRFPKFQGYNAIQYATKWKRFFQDHEEYQIVHGHMRSTASIYLLIAKKQGRYTIAHSHSTSNGKGVTAFVKNVMQFPVKYIADYLFSCSDSSGKWLFGSQINNKKKYSVIHNAIEVNRFIFNASIRKSVREELKIQDDCLAIGTIGRITEPKNPHGVIEIFRKYHYQNCNSKLIWVGEGNLKQSIILQANELGLADSIIFIDKSLKTNEILQAIDIFILPSLWEGLPLSLIEAQAAGIPCLVSDNISDEVLITDLVQKLPLKKGYDEWIQRIQSIDLKRMDTLQDIIRAGYDISSTATWIEYFYKEAVSR